MKKYIAILLLILTSQVAGSQTIDKLFKEFSKMKHTEQIQINSAQIGSITLKQIKASTQNMGVNNIELFNFDNCSNKVKERFNKAIQELDDPLFETLLTSNEDNNRRKVMIRIEDETIRELVILTTGDNSNLIRIKGEIKLSDINKMLTAPNE